MTTVKLIDLQANIIDTIYNYENSALNMALSCRSIIWKKEIYKIFYSTYDMDSKIAIISVEKV